MKTWEAKWSSKDQMKQLMCQLVNHPSVTGSPAEGEIAEYIAAQLRELPYFQENLEHLKLNPTEDGRWFVTALVKKSPEARKTVILISHFDVVDVQDYGSWKDQAFAVEELTKMFYAHRENMAAEVRHDLEQGDWLFGRGTMDMKCGTAVHMSMIEQACNGVFDGNILLLVVPDEEANSVGMRAAVPVLLELATKHGLNYEVVLNSEPMFPRYPGDFNQYVYTGSIGKILPGFLCYGKETHVGEPLSGLNANFMASQVTCEMELNLDYCEQVEGDVTPPPTNLIQRDLKEEYSVQIPHRAVTLFNLFIYDKSISHIMNALSSTAETAARKIEHAYAERATQYTQRERTEPRKIHVRVLTYQELSLYAENTYGKDKLAELKASISHERGEKDDRDATIALVDQLAVLCKELSPMIVVFLAPPYYPAVSSRKHPMIQQVVPSMIEHAKAKHAVTLEQQNYFGGISDLSYVGLQHPAASFQTLVANMPLWDQGYCLPLKELEAFDVPVLNIGPVGRDAHKWTERLDVNYAFEVLPDLLKTAIERILGFENRA